LYGFVEDVLSENTRQMSCAFPPSKNNGMDIIVFDEMAKLPDTAPR
jgi:hypothetical protein